MKKISLYVIILMAVAIGSAVAEDYYCPTSTQLAYKDEVDALRLLRLMLYDPNVEGYAMLRTMLQDGRAFYVDKGKRLVKFGEYGDEPAVLYRVGYSRTESPIGWMLRGTKKDPKLKRCK